MSIQKKIFKESEGDKWFERNAAKMTDKAAQDPVLRILKDLKLRPKTVLEIGCSNGWRLAEMKKIWPDAVVKGIDPSSKAAEDSEIEIITGTADELPFEAGAFDIVVFGFCLYLCDREDLFRIAAEADRVLRDGGHMVTYDFHAEQPYKNAYTHKDGLYSYKMDYSRLFLWNPVYSVAAKIMEAHHGMDAGNPDNMIGVFAMKKNVKAGWPEKERK